MGKTSQWLMEKLSGTKPQFMVVIANMVPAIPNGVWLFTFLAIGFPVPDHWIAIWNMDAGAEQTTQSVSGLSQA